MKTTIFFLILTIAFKSFLSATNLGREFSSESNNNFVVLGINDSHKGVYNNIKYQIQFDHKNSSFKGEIENVGPDKIPLVILRIFLSNGEKLGPEVLIDLLPREKKEIFLINENNTFYWWTFHITFQHGMQKKYYRKSSEKDKNNRDLSSAKDKVKGNNEFNDIHKGEVSTKNIKNAESSTQDIHKGETSKGDLKD